MNEMKEGGMMMNEADEKTLETVSAEECGAEMTMRQEMEEKKTEDNKEKPESEAERILREFEAFRRQTARENLRRDRTEEFRRALRRGGVKREEFVELLCETGIFGSAWESAAFDAEAAAKACRERYSVCFCETGVQGIEKVSPPVDSRSVPDEDAMSDEEYYRRKWKRV